MDTTTHPFTEAEFQRLAVYRSAVAAGFYTDSGETITAPVEARITDDLPGATSYPFTRAERARLVACRGAVRAGFYSEQA